MSEQKYSINYKGNHPCDQEEKEVEPSCED